MGSKRRKKLTGMDRIDRIRLKGKTGNGEIGKKEEVDVVLPFPLFPFFILSILFESTLHSLIDWFC
jgi:hypothetical protein